MSRSLEHEDLPVFVEPMLAAAGDPVRDEAVVAELKWDGARAQVRIDRGTVTVRSRHRTDFTAQLPELAAMGEQIGGRRRLLLDGEIVVCDASDGKPNFDRLRRRISATSERSVAAAARAHPIQLKVFDLLHADGLPTRNLAYRDRRALLEGLDLAGGCWSVPDTFNSAEHDLFAVACAHGLEGVVLKRLDQPYLPGKRRWTKVKNLTISRFEVTGWAATPPGEPDVVYLARRRSDGRRAYVGAVPIRGEQDCCRRLRRALDQFSVPSEKARTWRTAPGLGVDVAHHGAAGALRDPSFRDVVLPDEHNVRLQRTSTVLTDADG